MALNGGKLLVDLSHEKHEEQALYYIVKEFIPSVLIYALQATSFLHYLA